MPTLVFATGLEHQIAVVGAAVPGGTTIWNSVNGSVSINTTTKRTGSASLRMNPASAQAYVNKVFTSSQHLVGVVYVNFASLPTGQECRLVSTVAASGYLLVGVDTNGKWYVEPGNGADRVTDSVGPSVGTWYRIDFYFNSSGTNHVVNWKIGGVTKTSATSTDNPGAANQTTFYLGPVAMTSCSVDVYFDDIAYSVTAADYPIGGIYIDGHQPTQDGTHVNEANFADAGDAAISGTNPAYDQMDVVPISSRTEYVTQTANGTNDYVEVLFSDSSRTDTLLHVHGVVALSSDTATGNNCAVYLRQGTSSWLAWFSGDPSEISDLFVSAQFALAPDAGAWTVTKFNDLKLRFGYSSDANPDPRCGGAVLEAVFKETESREIIGSVTITLTVASAMVFTFAGSIIGNVTLTFSVSSPYMARGRTITGTNVVYFFQEVAESFDTTEVTNTPLGGVWWLAQTFKATSNHKAVAIEVRLSRSGGWPGTITASLRAASGNVPIGSDLTSGTTDGDTLGTNSAAPLWRRIIFTTPVDLVNGNDYAIVLRAPSAGGQYVKWKEDYTGGTNYPDGNLCQSGSSGESWTQDTYGDVAFIIYKPVGATMVYSGGGNIFNEAASLGVSSGLTAAAGLLASGAISLGASGGFSNAAKADLLAAFAFNVAASYANSVQASLQAAESLSASLGIASAATSGFSAAFALGVSAGLAAVVRPDFYPAVAFDVALGMTLATRLDAQAQAILGATLGLAFTPGAQYYSAVTAGAVLGIAAGYSANEYFATLALAASLGLTPAPQLTAQANFSAGTSVGLTHAARTDARPTITLGAVLDLLASGGLLSNGALSLGASLAVMPTAQMAFNPALAAGTSMDLAAAPRLDAQAAATLGASLNVIFARYLSYADTITLGAALGIAAAYAEQAYYEAMSLAASLSMTPAPQLAAQGNLSAGMAAGLTNAARTDFNPAISLGATKGISFVAQNVAQPLLTLAASLGISTERTAGLSEALALGASGGTAAAAQLDAQPALVYGVVADLAMSGRMDFAAFVEFAASLGISASLAQNIYEASMSLATSLNISPAAQADFRPSATLGAVGGLMVAPILNILAAIQAGAAGGLTAARTATLPAALQAGVAASVTTEPQLQMGAAFALGLGAAMATAGRMDFQSYLQLAAALGISVSLAQQVYYETIALGTSGGYAISSQATLGAAVALSAVMAIAAEAGLNLAVSVAYGAAVAMSTAARGDFRPTVNFGAGAGLTVSPSLAMARSFTLSSSMGVAAQRYLSFADTLLLGLTGGLAVVPRLDGQPVVNLGAVTGVSLTARGDFQATVLLAVQAGCSPAAFGSFLRMLALAASLGLDAFSIAGILPTPTDHLTASYGVSETLDAWL